MSEPEKLRKCLRAYIDFGLQNPNHYYVTFGIPEHQWVDVAPESDATMHKLGDSAFQRLRDGIGACQASGDFRIADLETTSQSVWMMIHGVVSLLITMPTHFQWVDRETLIESSLDQIVRSLRA